MASKHNLSSSMICTWLLETFSGHMTQTDKGLPMLLNDRMEYVLIMCDGIPFTVLKGYVFDSHQSVITNGGKKAIYDLTEKGRFEAIRRYSRQVCI